MSDKCLADLYNFLLRHVAKYGYRDCPGRRMWMARWERVRTAVASGRPVPSLRRKYG